MWQTCIYGTCNCYKTRTEWKMNSLIRRKKNQDILRYEFRIAIRYKFFVYCNIPIYQYIVTPLVYMSIYTCSLRTLCFEALLYLRNECLFFSVHGIWIAVRNKQIAWTAKRFSCDLFVPHCDSYPMNREKKTLIPYIYNASNKDPF